MADGIANMSEKNRLIALVRLLHTASRQAISPEKKKSKSAPIENKKHHQENSHDRAATAELADARVVLVLH
jgi:hypothetical protein